MVEFFCVYLAIGCTSWIALEFHGVIRSSVRSFAVRFGREPSTVALVLLPMAFVFAWPLLIILFIRWRKEHGA